VEAALEEAAIRLHPGLHALERRCLESARSPWLPALRASLGSEYRRTLGPLIYAPIEPAAGPYLIPRLAGWWAEVCSSPFSLVSLVSFLVLPDRRWSSGKAHRRRQAVAERKDRESWLVVSADGMRAGVRALPSEPIEMDLRVGGACAKARAARTW